MDNHFTCQNLSRWHLLKFITNFSLANHLFLSILITKLIFTYNSLINK